MYSFRCPASAHTDTHSYGLADLHSHADPYTVVDTDVD
jgi:hypothetical protein